ncbi:E3 ubiquitin-protein ligase BRE1-like 2 [Ipomoea triloba]|uniref:E3 ubiquitin-protein ligase BRE1-like 2 n=1 Tax=Ipomoea triloba TaxID=35885 RepID=UPI00125DD0A4|nr:E3 ubiquitin-protein ligase BRE1-like 2 [Ipomoea triloba]
MDLDLPIAFKKSSYVGLMHAGEEMMGVEDNWTWDLVDFRVSKKVIEQDTETASMEGMEIVPIEKVADTIKDAQELKDSIEEIKVLAEDRLIELQGAKEDNFILAKQLQDLQAELKDDRFVYSNDCYTILNDQLHHWNVMTERYKLLAESSQTGRSFITWREKESAVKTELVDDAKKAINEYESKIEELEHLLQRCITEKNEMEIIAEEAIQNSGQKCNTSEYLAISSVLSKEAELMKAQLNRWKDTTEEALHLSEEAQSLSTLLDRKTAEQKDLADKCAQNTGQIKSLEELVEKMQREKEGLELTLEMYNKEELYDNRLLMTVYTRNLKEIQESERKAQKEAKILRNYLEDYDHEMGVKAANESEAACQQRLSAAEAEIAQLQAELEASERDVLKLRKKLKVKEGEAEAYISEIEVVGQSYEDMQDLNQHLLQMVAERAELNIKLVSESTKTKQEQSLLLSTRQELATQHQQSKASLESLKMRMAHSENQMRDYVLEALNYKEEDRHLAVSAETVKLELLDAEKELTWMKSAVSSSEKEYEQIQQEMGRVMTELETERTKKKQLDDELVELNKTVEELTSQSGEDEIQKLQDEINECKATLKCGVCIDRQKEVVIAKCYHMFCYPCIQRNLEMRHQRCPGCGTTFGQNDVKFVKF